jgi:hypothetical protein
VQPGANLLFSFLRGFRVLRTEYCYLIRSQIYRTGLSVAIQQQKQQKQQKQQQQQQQQQHHLYLDLRAQGNLRQ